MVRLIPTLCAAERAAFLSTAQRFLRVPYKHRGRSFKGVDCIGLPMVVLGMLGYRAQDRRDYSPAPDGVTLRASLVAHLGDPISLEQAQPGDIALMRWYESKRVIWFNHVGILTPYHLGGFSLLHSYMPNKEVIEHRLGKPWDRRVVEVFSLTGEAA